jgi:hypothetical protein
MKYVIGYLFVVFGLYVHIMNVMIAITAGKTKAINEKGHFPSRVTFFDFVPIQIGLPFITNFSYTLKFYIFIAIPLLFGFLVIEELAYRITFLIVKRKNRSRMPER